jgi:hypothetical protein
VNPAAIVRAWAMAVRADLERLEDALHRMARGAIAVRMIDRVGWTRLLRFAFAGFWLFQVLVVISGARKDLLHPTDLGSDSSNYVAAAERLVAGHDLYALQPGDRPAPLDNSPEWTVPILSPPTAPTVLAWTVLLPDGIRLYPTWALGLAGTVAAGFLAAALAPPLFLLVATQYLAGLALTAWSGNVNALIAPMLIAIWWGARAPGRWPAVLAGVLVALAVAIKIGPLVVALWLLAQRRRDATIAMVAAGGVIAAATLALAGPGSVTRYLGIARDAAAMPAELSLPGILTRQGLPPDLAAAALPAALIVAAVIVVAWPRRPEAFLLAVLGSIFATTVVRLETIGVFVAAGAAWSGHGLLVRSAADRLADRVADHGAERVDAPAPPRIRPSRAVWLSTAAGLALALVAFERSVLTGGLDRSSLTFTNDTDRPIVVRATVTAQVATFGFVVPARSSVAGWRDLVAGAPPILTIWSADCSFLRQVRPPRTGGGLRLDQDGLFLGGLRGDAPPAPFAPDCTAALKARRHVR